MHDSNGNSDAGGHDHAEDHPATSGGDDRNAPLPVLSRDAALSWTRAFTGTMAECAGAVVRPETAVERFYDCVGRRGEVAEDGRFQLFFYVRARLATEAHVAAAVRLAGQLGVTEAALLSALPYASSSGRVVTSVAAKSSGPVKR